MPKTFLENYDLTDQTIDAIERMASEGNLDAQIYLGWAFDRFGPLPLDEKAAEHWLKKASESQNIEALRRYARFLYDRHRPEARGLVDLLIKKEDFFGYYLLGHAYNDPDQWLEKDPDEARKMLLIASKKGHLVSNLDFLKLRNRRGLLRIIDICKMIFIGVKIFFVHLTNPESLATYK